MKTWTTLVIAVKTFSRMALGCAFCGPLVWIFRPMAHGLAINLQKTDHDTIYILKGSVSFLLFFKLRTLEQSVMHTLSLQVLNNSVL